MRPIIEMYSVNWGVALTFCCIFLVLANAITILLLRDSHRKHRIYKKFSNRLSECVIVLSQKMEFLYGLPLYMSDYLVEKLNQNLGFQDLLDSKDWNRLKLYLVEYNKHREMPFVFSIHSSDDEICWYELRCTVERINALEFNYVCFLKNISREAEYRKAREQLQESLDSLLQNTGDFLWMFDVEDRKLKLLTPLMDENFQILPQSALSSDIRQIMPERDSALIDRTLDERVLEYRRYGVNRNPMDMLKIRLYRTTDKTLVWYGLRGKLKMDENERLVFQGVARRIETLGVNPIHGNFDPQANLAAMLPFPDIRVFWVDQNLNVAGCNQAFATDLLFLDPKRMVGMPLKEVMKQKFMTIFSNVLSQVLEKQAAVSWKGRFKNEGSMLMLNALPIKHESKEQESKDSLMVLCIYCMLDSKDFNDETSNQ